MGKFKLKDQLAGIAALIAAIVAIGGGFVKYGEITTKLNAIEAREETVVNTSTIESAIAVLEEKVKKLENKKEVDVSSIDIQTKVNATEIELLKTQIEEIKISTSNPLSTQ